MMFCSNCREETKRLIEPAMLKLPVDLSEMAEGELVIWNEPKGAGGYFTIVEKRGEKFLISSDSDTDFVCVACFTYAVWPSLFPYIANKPPQIILNGWSDPIWKENPSSATAEGR